MDSEKPQKSFIIHGDKKCFIIIVINQKVFSAYLYKRGFSFFSKINTRYGMRAHKQKKLKREYHAFYQTIQIQAVKERKTWTDNKGIKFCQNGDSIFWDQ